MKVRVDPDICMGCGICEATCPGVFQLTDDGYAVVLLDPVPPEHEDAVNQAKEMCPEEAISID